MVENSYHVIAGFDGGWNVKQIGVERAVKSFTTQKEAIEYGRNISRNHSTELVIHGRDGRLVSKEFYGKDPSEHLCNELPSNPE